MTIVESIASEAPASGTIVAVVVVVVLVAVWWWLLLLVVVVVFVIVVVIVDVVTKQTRIVEGDRKLSNEIRYRTWRNISFHVIFLDKSYLPWKMHFT